MGKKTTILEAIIFNIIFLTISFCYGTIYTADEMLSIKDNILRNYDPGIIPTEYGQPINVTVSVNINDMVPLEHAEMHYSVDCHFGLRWYDYRLKFNTTHGGLDMLPFSYTFLQKIWAPDLYFTSAKEGQLHTLPQPNILVSLRSDGTVFTERRLTIDSFCPMEFVYYPFDIQTCKMNIEPYSYNEEYMRLLWRKTRSANTEGVPTDKYHIDKFSHVNIRPSAGNVDYSEYGIYSRLTLEFTLYRNLVLYILRDFFPCLLITCLSWITFWINHQSTPARVALGITTVLTIVTMTNSVKAQAPPVGKFRSIDYYLLFCNIFVFAALVEFAIVGMTPEKKEKKVKNKVDDSKVDDDSNKISFQNGRVQLQSWSYLPKHFNYNEAQEEEIIHSKSLPNLENTHMNGTVRRNSLFSLENSTSQQSLTSARTKKSRSKHKWPSMASMKMKTILEPHWIDRTCRIAFPVAFVLMNVVFFVFHRLNPATVD